MADPVYKKIELVGTSGNSFSKAAANAIAKAAETVRNMSWFEVAVFQKATGNAAGWPTERSNSTR